MRYRLNSDGTKTPIAGRGRAEYGASTVRTGTVTNVAISVESTAVANITFTTAMPDANYLVDISECNYGIPTFSITEKTTTGFKVVVYNPTTTALSDLSFNYTAFKLYTDTEYNEVLERVDADTFGTGVDFSSYSSSNPYICPSDGYAIITSPTGVNKQSILYVDGTYFGLVETVRTGYPTVHSVFVKKGFRIYGGQTAGATDGSFKFLPLV